jgi:hypothetical protein
MDRGRALIVAVVSLFVGIAAGLGAVFYAGNRADDLRAARIAGAFSEEYDLAAGVPPGWPVPVMFGFAVFALVLAGGLALWLWLVPAAE